MNYLQLDLLLKRHGLDGEPAFKDVNVAIQELPEQYSNVLGLYYPDEQFIVVPPGSNEQTILHELGHRYGHYYQQNLTEKFAEQYRLSHQKNPVTRSPVAFAGAYSETTVIHPNTSSYGQAVDVAVTIKNTFSYPITFYIVGVQHPGYDDYKRFIDWVGVTINPGEQRTVNGSFNMPNYNTSFNIAIWYTDNNGEYHQDDGIFTGNIKLVSQINYVLQSDITYAAYGTYSGDFERCTVTFTAPLTIIPGVSWLINQILNLFRIACIANKAIPLEMKVFTAPGSFGSTDYKIEFSAYSNVATRQPVAFVFTIKWAALIAAVLIVGMLTFTVVSVSHDIHQPKVVVNQSEQTRHLPANASFSNLGPANDIVTAGADGATITTKDGDKITVQPGMTATLPIDATVVFGSSGGDVYIPAYQSSTGPSINPTPTDWTKVAKYGAIGLSVFAGAMLVSQLVTAFKPVRAVA